VKHFQLEMEHMDTFRQTASFLLIWTLRLTAFVARGQQGQNTHHPKAGQSTRFIILGLSPGAAGTDGKSAG